MVYRGRRRTDGRDPEPQQRDLEIIRALYRYRYLTTGQIADTWWPGCHLTRAQVRLRRMHDVGWIDRLRPRLERGSHEWIYYLEHKGFRLGQSYVRGGAPYIPREAKWRPRDVVDLDYVCHDLELNDWMLAYARLLGEGLDDWLGPTEAAVEIESNFDSALRRHVRLTAQRVTPDTVHVGDLRLGEELWPIFPDAGVLIADPTGGPPTEVLVEHDRTRRPAKNLEKFRRYDTLLTIGWRAVARFRSRVPEQRGYPRLVVAFVCQPGTVMAFMAAADGEVTGRLHSYLNPQPQHYVGRRAMVFCDAEDLIGGSRRAWLLPTMPPDARRGSELQSQEVLLPGYEVAAGPTAAELEWRF
jgi:Replication-relaxation